MRKQIMEPEEILAASFSYTKKTVEGAGAIKGKNCVIESITEIEGGHRVAFKWTLDDGTVQRDTMDVMDGEAASDYEGLSNQPRINGFRLTGNKSSADLGLQPNMSTAAQFSFGALASLTAYLSSNRKIPNNSTIHINDYDTDYVVSARVDGDTEDSCIFISDTQKITPYYQLGVLDIRAFGAGHTNTAENSAKIVKAIKYAQGNGIKLYVPRGRWYLKESVPLSGSTVIEGATSAGDRGLYFANCSMLLFDPEQSNVSMFTESGSHTLSIRHITLICGKIAGNEAQLYTTYEGNYTTQVAEIPHNYMTWTYSYENVNCLNCYNDSSPLSKHSQLDLLDVNIVGFSGYGVKCGNALTLNSVRFAKCKYGFYNVLTDNQFYETFIQSCEYGFYWDAGEPLIMLYDTWIDQCKYGLFSTMGLGGLFQGGEIDHCLYAGMCCLGSCDMKVEARFGRLGMYYLGEDMLAKAKLIDTYTEESFLDMSKGVDIAIRWGNKFNIDLSEEPKNISDNGTETSKLPTLLVFGQTLRGIIKTAHNFKDRAYYAIQNACVTTIDAYSLTNIAELPSPAAYRLDKLFLLTETQTGHVKGGIYKCVAKGTNPETYEWELINEPSDEIDLVELGLAEDLSQYEDAVNVKTLGATGDGTTDDSAAFLSAINTADVSTIVIPKGTYNLAHTNMILPSNITFVGEGKGLTVLKDASIEAPYGITVKNVTFDGGTARTVSEGGFPSGTQQYDYLDSMQDKDVAIFVTPRYDNASVIYENCAFKNMDIASLAFWGGNEEPSTGAKPLIYSIARRCDFEDIANCGIWHSVNITSADYSDNTFKNIGTDESAYGKVWGISLGDISNNTNQEVTNAIIVNNRFETLSTAVDPTADKHTMNANFIAIVCDTALIKDNMCQNLTGYGNDREGIYTKGNDVEIAYNTIINACPGGEGNICCKHKQFKQSEKRLMRIHDNTIISGNGTGIMCYGTGDIRDNYINISKVYRAIRGNTTHPVGNEYIIMEDNNISCGVGPLTVGETEITGYGPENLISIGSEYPNGIHINRNTITVTNDGYSDVFVTTLFKIQKIISDVEIKGNNVVKSASTNAMQLTDSSSSTLSASKNITIDIEDNFIDTQKAAGIYIAVKDNTYLKKKHIVKGNIIKSIVASSKYGCTIDAANNNTDVLYYESNQPKTAFTAPRQVYTTVKDVYTSLASNFFQIDTTKTTVHSAVPSDYMAITDIKSIAAASSDFADFQTRIAAL